MEELSGGEEASEGGKTVYIHVIRGFIDFCIEFEVNLPRASERAELWSQRTRLHTI